MKSKTIPTLISYETYINYRKTPFYYVHDLKYTLNYYGIEHKGNRKPELMKQLDKVFKNIKSYEKHIDQINIIKQYYKKYRNRKNKSKGLGFYVRDLCHNTEDFYTFENVKDIEDNYFFSFKDIDNFIYGFDIRSFKLLIESNNTDFINPYNRKIIPKEVKTQYNEHIKYLTKFKIDCTYEKDIMTPEQEFNDTVLSIFQKIDILNVAAGGTNPQWFHNLTVPYLKEYYKILEDVWNYRAQLSPQKQLEIVPQGQLFKISVKDVFKLSNKQKIQNIIINEIDMLISSAEDIENKSLGCYYVLTALIEVSPECFQSLPWLAQNFN